MAKTKKETGGWIWGFFGLNVIGLTVLWWFGWLPVIGSIANSGVADPTVIKWYLTIMTPIWAIFLFYSIYRNTVYSVQKMRANAVIWPIARGTVNLIILTIFAWLLDDKIQAVFTNGVPVLGAYDATQTTLYIQWTAFLIVMILNITLTIVATVGLIFTSTDIQDLKSLTRKYSRMSANA